METMVQGVEIENDDYHQGPGVSNSALQLFRRDPREYQWRYVLGNHDRERRDYFDFGSAVHEMALLRSDAKIKLIPENVLAKNGAKSGQLWKEFAAENYGFLLLKQSDFDAVTRCVESIYAHPLAAKLLACDGPAERMFTTEHPSGITLKCKPDKLAVTPHGVMVVDLKTTDNPQPAAFVRSVISYGYDCQAYFYQKILRACGYDILDFVFVTVGKSEPHCVNCISINEEDYATAAVMVENSLADLAERTQSGNWLPKDADKITKISLPRYGQYRTDYDL